MIAQIENINSVYTQRKNNACLAASLWRCPLIGRCGFAACSAPIDGKLTPIYLITALAMIF